MLLFSMISFTVGHRDCSFSSFGIRLLSLLGMIFLKFLDDYQRIDQPFSLFTQRINERRRMTLDQMAQNPVLRFRQTFDLLEKQIKHSSKFSNAIFSKIVKKLF
jgi:UDP-N-acetylmuramyl pentapeptide phosphotransferase/UDP-N-acetylglucosamine-1-phosphate transferase